VFTPTMIRVGYTKDNRPSRPDRSNLGLNPEACRSIWVIRLATKRQLRHPDTKKAPTWGA
jgi:hypothetical protein